jgi:hypothetical protein
MTMQSRKSDGIIYDTASDIYSVQLTGAEILTATGVYQSAGLYEA